MISIYLKQLLVLVKRLLICYLVYLICRLLFYAGNFSYFRSVGFFTLLKDCFFGLRSDSFSIVISNSLFILLSVLPIHLFWHRTYQAILKWLFYVCNAIFIAVNCVDIGYFPFIRKRSSADLLEQIGGQSDMARLLPQFIKDFWWVLFFYILLVTLLVWLYKRVQLPAKSKYTLSRPSQWVAILLLFILSVGMAVIGVRGGFQRVPITIVDAGAATNTEEVPLVLNTPFTIIKSIENKSLQEYTFYTSAQLKSIYNPLHHYKDSSFKKQNVVVLILESFAKEYTKLGRKSRTPFLDSLMDKSLVCTNAFSNGSKSIEGIPAILSSLPSLMENPFINSLYSFNDQTSFASILNAEGYQTAFFHGGINGTMNFDDWALLAGYSAYYGRNEYNNDADFDHFWGIWDEPFLQYSIRKMNDFRQPFHSAIFTLSSHHPYKVPEKYKNKFPKGELENAESIGYADYALHQFFLSAKNSSWYKNTLFVLTADHGSLSSDPFYSNVVGNQTIPVLFFRPDNSLAGTHDQVFSQIDILPSTLNLLGYNKFFFSFGDSYLSDAYSNNYFYASATHYLFGDSLTYCFKETRLNEVIPYRRDSTLSKGVKGHYPKLDSTATKHYKAFLQTYNYTLLHNTGRAK